jgi:hypothetical protein
MIKRGIDDELREINVGGVSASFFELERLVSKEFSPCTGIKKEIGESEKDISPSLRGCQVLLSFALLGIAVGR